MFENKMTTRDQAIKRYGEIDFASLHWPDASKWLVPFVVPPEYFPNWRVLNTKLPVTMISCNKDMHDPLQRALEALFNARLAMELVSFDGCFNVRMVRGTTSSPSAHSYGLAIDLNAATNPMGPVLHTTMSAQFVKCFTDQGFDWGGEFHSRKDPMHFSYCWE